MSETSRKVQRAVAIVARKGGVKRIVPWMVITLVGLLFSGIVAVCTRDSLLVTPAPPLTPAPSLTQLNQSIELAEDYLGGLYKPLNERTAVQSEYYGIPLRVFFHDQNYWSLLGADASSTITPLESSQLTEGYDVSFENGAFTATVRLEWHSVTGEFSLSLTPHAVKEALEVWLGPLKVGSYSSAPVQLVATTVLHGNDLSTFASLRYTVRHATQQAYLFYLAKGEVDKATKLSTFLEDNGYQPGYDMRAVLFNRLDALPDDLPLNQTAYQDCDHLPSGQPTAYAYQSKACEALWAYLVAGERDPFLQATYALQMLEKYRSPLREYELSPASEFWLQADTPMGTAEHLRLQWGRTNVGIPACTPLDCSDTASGIRTFVYGTLEAELGYRYGDRTAVHFADAAAAMTVTVQVVGGMVRMPQGNAYRPTQTGAFPVSWDQSAQFAPPKTSLASTAALTVIGKAAMPAEYVGISPSNSETTFDAWAFLVRYRCLKYATGCLL